MRYFKIAFGMFKMLFVSFFSRGKIILTFPVRLEKNVSFSRRKGGKIELGKHVSINANARLAVTENAIISVGSYSGIGDNNVIVAREKIQIGNNSMFGPNVCIYDHDHVFREPGVMRNLGYNTEPVIIEDNVWLGAGVIVLKGVTIGEGSIIAAGTIVNKDIPKNSIVYNKKELIIKERIEGM